MHAVIGVLFLVLTVLLYKFTYLHTRRPAPRAWTRQSLPSGLAFAGILLFLSIGGCYAIYFVSNLSGESFGVLDGVLVAVFLAGGWFGTRKLNLQWQEVQSERPARLVAGAGGLNPSNDP